MKLLNGLMTLLFDLVFWPFGSFAPIWGLLVVSLVAGVMMLWLFGKTSNQVRIRAVRDHIRGNLIGIRLFGDDLGMLFRLLGQVLASTAVYLRYALVPMVVMLVPVLLILTQLNLRYGASPLTPGDEVVVKLKLREGTPLSTAVTLQAPDGVAVETPAIRAESLREVAWRIRAERPGDYRLVVNLADESLEKDLVVGDRWGAVSTLRTGKNLWEMVLYPGEAPLDSPRAESIEIRYDPLPLSFLGFNLHWLLVFFIASIAFGFLFRGPLGVEI